MVSSVTTGDDLDPAVERMLGGDEEAFRLVYRAVHPPLLRYLAVLVGASDAEDVASEAWTQAFRDLDRFEGGADGFRGWLTTIGRHRAMDHLRRQARQPLVTDDLEAVVGVADPIDVGSLTVASIGSEEALALIASLPRDQAEAIMLRTVLGFDAPTAARILGKRPGAVRSAAHRGLKSLSRRLDAAGHESPVKFFLPTRDTSPFPGAEGVR
jgi:RNA polymerase sigma-70 factor (ECF subfamily)